jgi:hypothetical protein
MDIPAGWISETKLRGAIGVVDEDKSKFHRNLVNWRIIAYCRGTTMDQSYPFPTRSASRSATRLTIRRS